ncbi:hypothetical protein CcI49_35350 [Frankia sp. CcI49]|uniref:hypothetical protein n=1 Tax=unclassified Frankia TaxID=2632575 RepID=UPI0006CA4042|nr:MULTISPECIES: hypothetical protein [unclassified Frankia]KPM52156.1 hypothetical protein ACG83_32125 [Frankia sp. R43]ONH51677.1 hypothetical protein CcI49_35350 [Frankia sp. CcI49]
MRTAFRLAAAVLVASFLLVAAPPRPAAACDVSYGYRPTLDFDDLANRRTCSTASSVTASVVVDLLALAALASASVLVYRRARAGAGPDADATLAAYLVQARTEPDRAEAVDDQGTPA